jgi:hypothetical protein
MALAIFVASSIRFRRYATTRGDRALAVAEANLQEIPSPEIHTTVGLFGGGVKQRTDFCW